MADYGYASRTALLTDKNTGLNVWASSHLRQTSRVLVCTARDDRTAGCNPPSCHTFNYLNHMEVVGCED